MQGLRGAYRVSRAGGLVAEGGSGLADDVSGEPCTPATRFQAASIGKNFIAASALLLRERGMLELDDPVSRWWPAPPAWEGMTVAHLLSHTAGLPHWSGLPSFEVTDPPSAAALLAQAAELPLLSPPGERWSYSGVGFLLAAAVVEAAAGEGYSAFVQSNLFEPLGMSSTTSGHLPERRATGHIGDRPVAPSPGLVALPGTGDVWTTVEDLDRYAQAALAGLVLSEASWRLMSAQHVAIEAPDARPGPVITSGYGYGTYIGGIEGRSVFFHTGDNPGFRALLAWLPETGVTIALLANEDSTVLPDVAVALLRLAD